MYQYKIEKIYPEIVPVIEIETIPLNAKGFADILSINLEYNIKLKRCKNRIDGLESHQWETVKKAINPYEYIYAYHGGHGGDTRSVAAIKPLSRSFFKMIEMIREFFKELIPDTNKTNSIEKIITLHVAEGPGGFIEAARYIRASCNDDHAIGITLIDDTNRIVPSWKSSRIFLENHPEVIISRGADGTGNIYHPENINHLENEITTRIGRIGRIDSNPEYKSNLAYLITADGGFDYSVEYNYQEQVSSKLIFCEILTALKYQSAGGGFICKFFDIISYFSVELIYLLYIFYDEIIIYKPLTSRIANSEKYIICRGFKGSGLRSIILPELFKILVDWNEYIDKTINHIFREIPNEFIEHMKQINKYIIDHQITNINNAINMFNVNRYNQFHKTENKKKIMGIQIANAIEWCQKYEIPHYKPYHTS